MPKQTLPLDAALRAILWRRLLLPFVIAAFIIVSLSAYYGGRLVEVQQLKYSQSIGYTVTHLLEYAGYELDAINAVISGSDLNLIKKSMIASQESREVFDTIYFLDNDKRIKMLAPFDARYVGLDMSRRSYFSELDCAAGVNFSLPFDSLRTGNPTTYLTRCTDEIATEYLVGELSLSILQDTISEAHRSSQGTVFIVDQTGALLAHPNAQLVRERINVGDMTIVKRGLEQDTTLTYWRDGGLWVGSASKIKDTGWIVIVEVPILAVYAPYIGAILGMSLAFMLIFSLAVRAFLFQLQRKLVVPLTYLSMSVDALANGNFNPTETVSDETIPFIEISSLLTNFRNMRRAIFSRETELKESERQYRRLLENSPDAILLHSDAAIIYANAAAVKLYAANDAADFNRKTMMDITHPDSHPLLKSRLEKLKEMEQILPLVEQKHIRFDQSVFHAEVIASSIFLSGTHVAQTIIRDITRRKSEEEVLKYRATHDPLTDLPNRFLFQDRLEHAIIRARRNATSAAVLYLDLDGFKIVNDAFGHDIGDRVLQRVSEILRNTLREEDTVARIGGDEFVILLDDLKYPKDAEIVAKNIMQALSEPCRIEDKEITLSLSVGISISPNDGSDTQSLLQSADAAMYKAKEEGKHRVKFYAPYMRAQSLERVLMQSQLSRALDENQLFLQYQPQVNYRTGEIIGVEALLRWRHPELGLISPEKFIPIAEDTGLILPIGEWVLKTACNQIKRWQEEKRGDMRVAVNLSNLQFKQPDIAQSIKSIIQSSGVQPDLLEIELMENIVFRDADSSFNNLYDLKSIGVVLAMDDFGAGFSTLGYLAHIPFDRIKIDQRLVANIGNAKDAAVVSGIIMICNNLNLEVLAEGVETRNQLTFCVEKGCNFFQGWYYSRAVDPLQIMQYLKYGVPWKNELH
jgi:diguanylate cyclase (GGDEF)-like protein/PAS domain S-box-containing protein